MLEGPVGAVVVGRGVELVAPSLGDRSDVVGVVTDRVEECGRRILGCLVIPALWTLCNPDLLGHERSVPEHILLDEQIALPPRRGGEVDLEGLARVGDHSRRAGPVRR